MARIYPGRVLGAGLTTRGDLFSVYLVTGRSEGSQARLTVSYPDERRVAIEPLVGEEEILAVGGDPKLLIYDAMAWDEYGLLATSNGSHTNRNPDGSKEGFWTKQRILGTC